MMNQHKNINNKRYFYNEARSQQSGDLRQEGKSTLVGCAKCGCRRCSSLMGLFAHVSARGGRSKFIFFFIDLYYLGLYKIEVSNAL